MPWMPSAFVAVDLKVGEKLKAKNLIVALVILGNTVGGMLLPALGMIGKEA